MRFPPITSTSRAHTDGQSWGQTEERLVTSAIAFIGAPRTASSDKAPQHGNNFVPLAFATVDNYKLYQATLLIWPMPTRLYLTLCIVGLTLPVTTWAESGSQL